MTNIVKQSTSFGSCPSSLLSPYDKKRTCVKSWLVGGTDKYPTRMNGSEKILQSDLFCVYVVCRSAKKVDIYPIANQVGFDTRSF